MGSTFPTHTFCILSDHGNVRPAEASRLGITVVFNQQRNKWSRSALVKRLVEPVLDAATFALKLVPIPALGSQEHGAAAAGPDGVISAASAGLGGAWVACENVGESQLGDLITKTDDFQVYGDNKAMVKLTDGPAAGQIMFCRWVAGDAHQGAQMTVEEYRRGLRATQERGLRDKRKVVLADEEVQGDDRIASGIIPPLTNPGLEVFSRGGQEVHTGVFGEFVFVRGQLQPDVLGFLQRDEFLDTPVSQLRAMELQSFAPSQEKQNKAFHCRPAV